MRGAIVIPVLLGFAGALAFATLAGRTASFSSSQPPVATARLRPVVVELFTSQGCSSCPPADEALAVFARDPNIVAISRPVTYWDTPGWHDTLARPANTALQRSYAARQHSDEVYTPQTVIQGSVALVGGRTGAIHRAIDEAAARPGPLLRIARSAAGAAITLEGNMQSVADIRLVALRARVPVRIGRGENGGRTIDYVNVVVGEELVGSWRGGALRLLVAASRLHVPGADRYALIVQEPDAGHILAAGYL